MGGKLKAWVVTWVMGGAINDMQQNKIKTGAIASLTPQTIQAPPTP